MSLLTAWLHLLLGSCQPCQNGFEFFLKEHFCIQSFPRVNAEPLDLPVQWDLVVTKDLPVNVVCQDLRVPTVPREALVKQENLESPERRDPMVPLVVLVTRVHQDLAVPQDRLDVMVLLESLDPLDLQVRYVFDVF